MSNDEKSSGKKGMDPTIATAIIGGVVTIVVAIIGVMANRPSTPATPAPTAIVITATSQSTNTPAPTDTAAPGEPSSTPAPATDTPMPTATFLPIGSDWANNCISSAWQPYSSTSSVTVIAKDGCLSQPVGSFSIANGALSLFYDSKVTSAETHGLFAPLPSSSGTVTIHISMKTLTTSDIWVGLFADQSPDSQGLLMTIPPAKDTTNLSFAAWQMPGLKKITTSDPLPDQGSGYTIQFEYTATAVRALVNQYGLVTNTYPVSSDQKWLFIGYRASNGNNSINGSFFNLTFGN